jgi:hypothetical protein
VIEHHHTLRLIEWEPVADEARKLATSATDPFQRDHQRQQEKAPLLLGSALGLIEFPSQFQPQAFPQRKNLKQVQGFDRSRKTKDCLLAGPDRLECQLPELSFLA